MGQVTYLTIEISKSGLWRIDGEFGKAIVILKITNKNTGETFSYAPTHEEICQIVTKMLEAELYNDQYEFVNGVYGPNSRRPTQIFDKIDELKRRLFEWENKALDAGLKRPIKNVFAGFILREKLCPSCLNIMRKILDKMDDRKKGVEVFM